MLTTHALYGRLAYRNESGYGADTFMLTGTGAPLVVVESMLMTGQSVVDICTAHDWLGLTEHNLRLVERVAEIHEAIRVRNAA